MADIQCQCSTRPLDEDTEKRCYLCKTAICAYCCDGDVEFTEERKHKVGLCKHKHSSNKANNNPDKSDKSDKAKPRLEAERSDAETESIDEKANDGGDNVDNVDLGGKLKQTGKRPMPQLLKESISSRDRFLKPFKLNLDPKKIRGTASMTSAIRVCDSVSKAASSHFMRVGATQIETPNTKLKVDYQFKAKITHESGVVTYKKFDIGDTDGFEDETIIYEKIKIHKDLKPEYKKMKKILSAQKHDRNEMPSDDDEEEEDVKEESDDNEKGVIIEDSDKSDTEEKEIPGVKRKSREQSEKAAKRHKTKTPPPPPAVNVTPHNAVRAPFSRTSGQSKSVKNAPSKRQLAKELPKSPKKTVSKIIQKDKETPKSSKKAPKKTVTKQKANLTKKRKANDKSSESESEDEIVMVKPVSKKLKPVPKKVKPVLQKKPKADEVVKESSESETEGAPLKPVLKNVKPVLKKKPKESSESDSEGAPPLKKTLGLTRTRSKMIEPKPGTSGTKPASKSKAATSGSSKSKRK